MLKRAWWIFILLFTLASASALEVKQARWGFDGTVVPGRFNLLSVLIENRSADAFDGTMTLYKNAGGMGQRVGALYGSPCYISPLATRWVQFYVYVENQYDQWRVEWGRGPDTHHDIDPPKWGPPGRVILSDSLTSLSATASFRQFPEELFPPTAAATSGLDSLLLDHVPRWELAKRQAFLDWLRAGGKVHLLTGADGRYPVFPDELSVLNSPVERLRVGAGLVIRHGVTAGQIKPQDVEDNDIPQRKYASNDMNDFRTTEAFLQTLSQLSHPSYNWALIYLMAVVYLGMVGPGTFFFGKRFSDYRLRIGLLLATIAVFAGLFSFVGRRGQGEASVVHTLSYADSIGGDNYNVMQWINVFATRGAHYTITHAAPHNLYATGQDYESVNGMIQSGKDGRAIVDVPMFSRRALLHQAEMKGANLSVNIVKWDGAETLNKLTLTVQPEIAKQVLSGWLVHGDQVYYMKVIGNQLEFENAGHTLLSAFISKNEAQPSYTNPYETGDDKTNVEAAFGKLALPLMAWSLETRDYTNAPLPAATSGRADLFLFARSPENFAITGAKFGHEVGYVLYHLNLFKPEL
jgi:hypothetical protein